MKEIEAKLKLNDLTIIGRADLKKIDSFTVLDVYFDNEILNFKSQDRVLRLRKEGEKSFIAYKGPREDHEHLIIREEIEPTISSFEEGLGIIKGLGFSEVAKVEKERSYFTTEKLPNLSITIDRYPFIGLFMEIEGPEPEVYEFLKENDLKLTDTIKKNCTELYLIHCKENNLNYQIPENHFTFQDEKELMDIS